MREEMKKHLDPHWDCKLGVACIGFKKSCYHVYGHLLVNILVNMLVIMLAYRLTRKFMDILMVRRRRKRVYTAAAAEELSYDFSLFSLTHCYKDF